MDAIKHHPFCSAWWIKMSTKYVLYFCLFFCVGITTVGVFILQFFPSFFFLECLKVKDVCARIQYLGSCGTERLSLGCFSFWAIQSAQRWALYCIPPSWYANGTDTLGKPVCPIYIQWGTTSSAPTSTLLLKAKPIVSSDWGYLSCL